MDLKKKNKFLLTILSTVIALMIFASTAFAATWGSSDNYGTWSNGGYSLYNDVWGGGAGPQSIWANNFSNWGVWSQQPNTGGIKSYPNSTRDIGARLSALSSVSSSFDVTVPTSGTSFESAYDIWAGNYGYEIMLWMNYYGGVKPISYNYSSSGDAIPVYTNVSIGGQTWNVYKGNNGSNNVFSLLRTSNTNSGTIDVLAVMNWFKNQGWYGDEILDRVQFGFEITSSPNGLNYNCNSYSVNFSTNGYSKLRNGSTGLYIDGMGRTSNGDNTGQWSNSSSYNQQWKIIDVGGYVKIQDRYSGLYLDGMGRTTNGSAAGQWSNGSSDNQQWKIESNGDYMKFQNRATGLYLDGLGSTGNGSDLTQYSSSTSYNQKFLIENP